MTQHPRLAIKLLHQYTAKKSDIYILIQFYQFIFHMSLINDLKKFKILKAYIFFSNQAKAKYYKNLNLRVKHPRILNKINQFFKS